MALEYGAYMGAIAATGAILAVSLVFLFAGAYRVFDARRKWAVFVDGDSMQMNVRRVRVNPRGFIRTGKKALKRTYTVDGNAHHLDSDLPKNGDETDIEVEEKRGPMARIESRLLPGHRGGGFIIHARTGWNLTAPRLSDWVKYGADNDGTHRLGVETSGRHGLDRAQAQDLLVSDPWLLDNAIEHNDAQDAIGANGAGESWKEKAIIWAVLLGMATLGTLGYLVMQLTKSGVIGGGG